MLGTDNLLFVPLPNVASATTKGLLNILSGNTTDFVDGTNACQNLANAITPTITSVRLRSFNALAWGNCSFEVDQRNCGTSSPFTAAWVCDRWQLSKVGTMAGTVQQMSGGITIPGTNFGITQNYLRVTLTTQEASLAAGDYLVFRQVVEGPFLRELDFDVHSLSILVRSSVAGLSFGLCLRDNSKVSLTKLATIPSANTWVLLKFENLPIWSPSGVFSLLPGNFGYELDVTLAAGTTYTNAANNTWQGPTVTAFGASGQSNFAASPVNSTFDIAFIQHEPGPVCSTLQDMDFVTNLDRCQRFFSKTYDYGAAIGSTTQAGTNGSFLCNGTTGAEGTGWFPRRMAKAPAVNIYHPSSGAINSVLDAWSGGTIAITGASLVGESGFGRIAAASGFTAGHNLRIQYTADTGW
jgi:hypothetical protein